MRHKIVGYWDAIHVRNDADLARSTADKLRNEADALADSVQATDERMRGYQGQAKEDEALAKEVGSSLLLFTVDRAVPCVSKLGV
ncbi:hypothetical protein IscW_ISCW004876 [Ixodes scapularis]|uniref:Uncharacterized protein n=1 Tax=Ixodes scapularis TaxID=6945 RepID=B7PEE6_IXOSC|nr:hypothetical protein IscW_ISCW004876 [Ixodes scapularis]|eukprot:XP_002433568.1 hypothetical protein IscW_ISCW004876 [Ixodes scapularis]